MFTASNTQDFAKARHSMEAQKDTAQRRIWKSGRGRAEKYGGHYGRSIAIQNQPRDQGRG
jgi:hypothetical protein